MGAALTMSDVKMGISDAVTMAMSREYNTLRDEIEMAQR
jgi:hypothetical protein